LAILTKSGRSVELESKTPLDPQIRQKSCC
jgi:hypothetical protein